MKNKNIITIAIPVYNKEKYIKNCIKSALSQELNNIQILVVDNNSSDNSWSIIKKFGNKIKAIQNSKNIGMAGNWNKCIKLSNSEFVMILHADDLLMNNSIRSYINLFKKNKDLGFIYAKTTNNKNSNKNNKIFIKGKESLDRILGAPDIPCSTVMIKKSIFNKLGYFIENSLSSDVEMRGRIAKDYSIGFLNQITIKVNRDNESTGYLSLINRNLNEIINDWENLTSRIVSYYKQDELKNIKKLKNKFMITWILCIIPPAINNKQYNKVINCIFLIIFKYKGLRYILNIIFKKNGINSLLKIIKGKRK